MDACMHALTTHNSWTIWNTATTCMQTTCLVTQLACPMRHAHDAMHANYFSRHSIPPNHRACIPLLDSRRLRTRECEGVSVYSVSTPLTVVLYIMEEDTRVLLPFAWDFSSVGLSARKWMSNYLKNGSLDIVPTFRRSLPISWRGPLYKNSGNFICADWEIFGVEEKIWKANILSRVIVIVATLPSLLATDHLHLQYFFQIFILTVHAAMTSSILGKTRYGVISKPLVGSPYHFFAIFNSEWVRNRVGLCTSGLEILIFWKSGWGKWVYPNYNLPHFSKFSSWFFNFFLNWIRSRWMERMLQWSHIFENYTVGATRLPQTFLNSKKLHFQIFIDQKQFKLGWFESW